MCLEHVATPPLVVILQLVGIGVLIGVILAVYIDSR